MKGIILMNIDLLTIAPIKDWDIQGTKGIVFSQSWRIGSRKNGQVFDMSNWPNVVSRCLNQSIYKTNKSSKSGSKKDNWWTCNRVMVTQGFKCVKREGYPAWFHPMEQLLLNKISETMNAGQDRKITEQTVHHSLLCMRMCSSSLVSNVVFVYEIS